MKSHKLEAISAAVVTSLVMAGCAGAKESGPIALVRADADVVTMTSTVGGTLALVSELCFGLQNAQGLYTLSLPHGTSFTSDSLNIPGVGEIGLGDPLESGGGFVSFERAGVTIPQSCRTAEVVVLTPAITDGRE